MNKLFSKFSDLNVLVRDNAIYLLILKLFMTPNAMLKLLGGLLGKHFMAQQESTQW
jgi:hypothetical protein